jgi:hypothetical protein
MNKKNEEINWITIERLETVIERLADKIQNNALLGNAIYHEFDGDKKAYSLWSNKRFLGDDPDDLDYLLDSDPKEEWESFKNQTPSKTLYDIIEDYGIDQICAYIICDKPDNAYIKREYTDLQHLITDGEVKKALAKTIKEAVKPAKKSQKVSNVKSKKVEDNNEKSSQDFDWYKKYVYDLSQNRFIQINDPTLIYTSEALNVKERGNSFFKKTEEKTSVTKPCIIAKQNCDVVESIRYNPKVADRLFADRTRIHLNSHVRLNHPKPSVDEVKEAQGILEEHLELLFMDQADRTLLMDFLAYSIQNQGELINWMLVMLGVNGTGKSWFFSLMQRILGEDNCKLQSPDKLSDNHLDMTSNRTFTYIEELKINNSAIYDVARKLREIIGNPSVQVRPFNKPAVTLKAWSNFLSSTNDVDALPFNPNERRYCVIKNRPFSDKLKLELDSNGYFKKLFGSLDKLSHAYFEIFNTWKISESFNAKGRAPKTNATFESMEAARPAIEVAMMNWLEEWNSVFICKEYLSVNHLKYEYKINNPVEKLPNDKNIGKHLESIGFDKKVSKRVYINQKTKSVTVYINSTLIDPGTAFERVVNEMKAESGENLINLSKGLN